MWKLQRSGVRPALCWKDLRSGLPVTLHVFLQERQKARVFGCEDKHEVTGMSV